jgi:hypothetical protein
MAVITAPRFAQHLSSFMFSASLVGALADAGVPGVERASAGAERMLEPPGPLVLG